MLVMREEVAEGADRRGKKTNGFLLFGFVVMTPKAIVYSCKSNNMYIIC